MQSEYFVPEDEDLMQLFFASIERGDRIPYTLIGMGYGIIKTAEEVIGLEIGSISLSQGKRVAQKALNIGKRIESYFRYVKNKEITVKTENNHLVVCDDRGVGNYSSMKLRRVMPHIRRWYRSLQGVSYRNISESEKEVFEKSLCDNAEMYLLCSARTKRFESGAIEPPMNRPIPKRKRKDIDC